ncbi:succinate dehydrogenase, cytochrome b556 subunit [Thiohalospira sp.]|uniref:succinate dehydrogenase, cytochrome b556 subunit n=1 Tax=Thiohalospira sp. TaxID=3080549 RepID=UPI003981627B
MARSPRPRNLDLWTIHFPVPAVLSILHRGSGLLLVLAIPWLAWLLERSVSGQEGFRAAADHLDSAPVCAVLVVLVWALAHHLFAGIRYLLLDLDIGVERRRARASAWLVNIAGAAVALLAAGRWWL